MDCERIVDRKPNPAPFPVGARVRYVGKHVMKTADGHLIEGPGVEAVVVETRPGRQGTLRWIDDGSDDDPIQDTTRDGYSIIEPAHGWRRIALPEKWELAE